MKNVAMLAIVMALTLLSACERTEFNPPEPAAPAATLREEEPCVRADYLTKDGRKVGLLTVEEVDSYLKFTFATSDGWVFRRIHLYAGLYENIPMSNEGVPKVGQFEYSETYFPYPNYEIFYIARERIEMVDSCFVAASQAEVYLMPGDTVVDAQYVWAAGTPFTGGTGAYFEYCLGCKQEPPVIPPDDSSDINLAPIPLESFEQMTPVRKPGAYPLENRKAEEQRK